MRDAYYTGDNIEGIISDLENETENSMKDALKTILTELVRIRNIVEKKPKVYTEPTNNKNDIIVGLNKQGVISDKDMRDTLTNIGGYFIKTTDYTNNFVSTGPLSQTQSDEILDVGAKKDCQCPICRNGR